MFRLCFVAVLLVMSQHVDCYQLSEVMDAIEMLQKHFDDAMNDLADKCSPKEPESKYIGCYKDKNDRMLPEQVQLKNVTNEKCNKVCAVLGYPYSGNQYGSQCFCGNSYRGYDKFSDSDCNMPCPGNAEEMCGGHWKMSVRSTGVGSPESWCNEG